MTSRINGKEQIDADNLTVKNKLVKDAAALSGSPSTGEIAVDSADSNKLKWYDGSAWTAAGGGAAGMPANSGPQSAYIDFKASGSGYSQFIWPLQYGKNSYTDYNWAGQNGSPGNNTVCTYHPIYSFGGGTVDSINVNRTGGANVTETWKLGVYSANSDTGLPDTLLDQNSFSSIGYTIGIISWSPSSLTFTAGTWYWLAYWAVSNLGLDIIKSDYQMGLGQQANTGVLGNTVTTTNFLPGYFLLRKTMAVAETFDAGPLGTSGWSGNAYDRTMFKTVVVYS
jgi:hypothetical protein